MSESIGASSRRSEQGISTATRRALLAGAVGLLGACRDGPTATPGPLITDPDDATITWFASSITQSQNDPRRVLVDAFEREHVPIEVRQIAGNSSTDTMRESLRRFIAAGSFPDVYLGDVIWPADFGYHRLAVALSDRLPETFWRRFVDGLVDGGKYAGKTFAAPFYADQGMLFYRTDLVPHPPATWEDLVRSAKDLRRRSRVKTGFLWHAAAYEGLTCCWTEFAADAGVPPPGPDGSGGRLDSQAAQDVLLFLRGLITDGISPDVVTSTREPQALQMFNAGQAAYLRGWNSAWVSMNTPGISQVVGKVGVAPLPTFAGQRIRYSTVGGWSVFVNPHTSKLDHALTFIKWMTDVEAQRIMARFSTLPTNAEVRSDQALGAEYPPLAAAVRATPISRPATTPNYRRVSEAIYTNINRALRGEVPVGAALRQAQLEVEQAFDQAPS
jgi:multiple sugar transport system substrate-binding protein